MLERSTTVALFFGLVACAAELPAPRKPEGPPPPTHALLALLPSTAVSVLYLNYERLRGDWKAVLEAGVNAQERREQQGFVETEDVQHAVLAALAQGSEAQNVSVYQGPFLQSKLEASALARHADLPRYRERRVWGRSNDSLALLQPNQLATGPLQAVQLVVDVKEALQPVLLSEPWFRQVNQELYRRWPAKQSVSLELLALGTNQTAERMREFFPAAADLRWFGLRAGGQAGFRLLAVGQAPTPKAAQNLVYALAARAEELAEKPQMRLMGIAGVLQALEFRADGPLAVVTLELAGAEWDNVRQRFSEIFAYLRKRQQAAQPQ